DHWSWNVGSIRTGGDSIDSGGDVVAKFASRRRHLGASAGRFSGALPEPSWRGNRIDPDGRGVALSDDDLHLQHGARMGNDPLWLSAAVVRLEGAAARQGRR